MKIGDKVRVKVPGADRYVMGTVKAEYRKFWLVDTGKTRTTIHKYSVKEEKEVVTC